MKELNHPQITPLRAFEAARVFFDKLSNELDSSDLVTLSFEMERTEGTGRTNDPALDSEWAMDWGGDAVKDSAGAFQVLTRFLERERHWSEERDLQMLLNRCKKMTSNGAGSDLKLAEDWNNALAACRGESMDHLHERGESAR